MESGADRTEQRENARRDTPDKEQREEKKYREKVRGGSIEYKGKDDYDDERRARDA